MSTQKMLVVAALATLAAPSEGIELARHGKQAGHRARARVQAKVDYDQVLVQTQQNSQAKVKMLDYDSLLKENPYRTWDDVNPGKKLEDGMSPEWFLTEAERAENGMETDTSKKKVEKTNVLEDSVNMTPYVRATKDAKWEAGVPNFESPESGYFTRTFASEAAARKWTIDKSGSDNTINYPAAPDVEAEDNPANPVDSSDKNPNTMQDGAVKPKKALSQKLEIEPAYVGEYKDADLFGKHIGGGHDASLLEAAGAPAGSGSGPAGFELPEARNGNTNGGSASASTAAASGSGLDDFELPAASPEAAPAGDCADCANKLDETEGKMDTLEADLKKAADNAIVGVKATKGTIIDVNVRRQSDDAAAAAAAADADADAAGAATTAENSAPYNEAGSAAGSADADPDAVNANALGGAGAAYAAGGDAAGSDDAAGSAAGSGDAAPAPLSFLEAPKSFFQSLFSWV